MNGQDQERQPRWKRGGGAVKLHHGAWYIRFSHGGTRREERTNARTEREARKILRDRLTDVGRGEYLPDAAKTRVGDLYEDMARDYRLNGKDAGGLERRWKKHLEVAFGSDLAAAVTTARLREYVEERSIAGAKPATIQVELAFLRRMFRLGLQGGKVLRVPVFPTITVNNTRKGFFEKDAFERVVAELPGYLRPLATVGYWIGWRKGELLDLERRQVDLEAGTVRLDPGTTKNKEGRLVYLPPEALAVLREWDVHTRELEREKNVIVRHVFHRDGAPIGNFHVAWHSACRRARVPGMIFHDLRRTAARNYVRSGVSEHVAMKVLGHKTRSVFDRYNITSEDDLRQAAATVLAAPRIGTIVGPVADFTKKKASISTTS
jgi:integrase